MITDLVLNSTLLVTLTVLFSFISRRKSSGVGYYKVLAGLLFGGIAVIGMNMPFTFSPGIIYDGRSIILSMAGLFGGLIPGLISMFFTGLYRVHIGGTGTWAGLMTIITSVLIGLLFRRIHNNKPENIKVYSLYLMGLVNHSVMLLCQLLLPRFSISEVIGQIWFPILLIFPIASLLMGLILRNEIRKFNAELAVKDSEIRYRTTLLSIGDGVITTDRNGVITLMNQTACQISGWSENDAIGKHIREVFTIESELTGNEMKSPVDKVLEEGKTIALANHTLLVTRKGERVPITDSSAPIKDIEGKVTGVVLIFKDQTEERKLKNLLIERERLFHTLTEKSPVGIFRTKPDGYTTYVNPKWCEISGMTFQEAQGYGWMDGVHPKDRKQLRNGWGDAIAEKKISTDEYRFIRPDKNKIWVLGVAVPEKSKNGELIGYIGTIIDITERKQTEKALVQSYENFRRTMDESPVGIRIVTQEGKTTYVNPAFLRLFGFKNISEYDLKPLADRHTASSLEQHILRKEKRIKGTEPEREYEIEIIRTDNEIRNLMVNRKKVFWDGFLQNLVIYQDFTEKKKVIEDLKVAKEKAEESDRLKSAFLANMSHEIRTPLNAIMGFTNLLVDEEHIEPTLKRDYASIITQSSENLLQIINDILDISRMETGQLKLYYSEFDICPVIRDLHSVASQHLVTYSKEHIGLICKLPYRKRLVSMDKTRFIQIFTNLLNNAIKFTKSGEISFGIENIQDNMVHFFVSDTGIGIEKEKQKDIFERFRQADETITRVHGGVGLGLSITKNLIEQMGGEIQVKSKPGTGTTFNFMLPIVPTNRN